jgi:hypothetical protein
VTTVAAIRKKLWTPRDRDDVPPLGTRETLAHWLLDEDHDGGALKGGSLVELVGYGRLLEVLPDKVVQNLERARQARDGRIPMMKAGLGYEELLSSVIVDGTAITSSSTEAFLFPALLIPTNYLQPGGIPGRTLSFRARGRHTTLTTAATLTFKVGAALTNVIPTTTWAVSGALTMDTTVQTATMWFCEGNVVVRSVGSAGTVFAMGDCTSSAQALTIANQTAQYMGSAGSATPATAAVDMTVPEFFSLTGKWSLATAYSITGHVFLLEALN